MGAAPVAPAKRGQTCYVSALHLHHSTTPRRMRACRTLRIWALYRGTSFDEVLLLDADSVPLVQPEELFETPAYVATGSLFTPDYWWVGSARAHTCWVCTPSPPAGFGFALSVPHRRAGSGCWYCGPRAR